MNLIIPCPTLSQMRLTGISGAGLLFHDSLKTVLPVAFLATLTQKVSQLSIDLGLDVQEV